MAADALEGLRGAPALAALEQNELAAGIARGTRDQELADGAAGRGGEVGGI
jgi:hypothetical protein